MMVVKSYIFIKVFCFLMFFYSCKNKITSVNDSNLIDVKAQFFIDSINKNIKTSIYIDDFLKNNKKDTLKITCDDSFSNVEISIGKFNATINNIIFVVLDVEKIDLNNDSFQDIVISFFDNKAVKYVLINQGDLSYLGYYLGAEFADFYHVRNSFYYTEFGFSDGTIASNLLKFEREKVILFKEISFNYQNVNDSSFYNYSLLEYWRKYLDGGISD